MALIDTCGSKYLVINLTGMYVTNPRECREFGDIKEFNPWWDPFHGRGCLFCLFVFFCFCFIFKIKTIFKLYNRENNFKKTFFYETFCENYRLITKTNSWLNSCYWKRWFKPRRVKLGVWTISWLRFLKKYIFFILLAKAVISKLNGIKFKNNVYVKRKY